MMSMAMSISSMVRVVWISTSSIQLLSMSMALLLGVLLQVVYPVLQLMYGLPHSC